MPRRLLLLILCLLSPLGAQDARDREIARRVALDFRLRRADVEASLRGAVRDFRPAELDAWIRDGLVDVRTIDGEARFHGSAKSNLFFRAPALAARRIDGYVDDLADALEPHLDRVLAAARGATSPYVLAQDVETTFTLTVKPDVVRDGAVVRAWLPLARTTTWQTADVVVDAAPKPVSIGAEDAPLRAAYCESRTTRGRATTFTLKSKRRASAVLPLSAVRGSGAPPLSAEERARALDERPPHVVFTPTLRRLADEIAGDERDPAALARRFYDWIGRNVVYSYAPEYSTLPNIAEGCAISRRGDCGQASLLFIALCRLRGVPARWQSGWAAWPRNETIHDWAEIWIDGAGWRPVDPFMSVFAETLPEPRRAKFRDFYFGGLDGFRFAANGAHGVPLEPAKTDLRSDDVDFQRGEAEADGRNLYFDAFTSAAAFRAEPGR